ncbi:LysR family transcriptional regulator [Antarctobacter heliothermus]|uniref:DNA-binding transcriptional regulator, LysR family n=1 Tax=Antarctobacter heliothermus TaxID=74033 RepID=A0A239KZV4_9RHOB|nr:LysR family transcriptional regulator [Antarctobacter heliothermus]SNT23856.1 DNA-binding transcriptional regulator, LysR family [Antarctobacter heliothermus]
MLKPYAQRFPWNLDWNLLRTFMVVVDEGGITPAAHFLGLKQPTISVALKRLEDIMGRKLVNRSPKHFSVTPWGRVLYAEASTIFGAVAQLPDLMGGLEDEVTGQISIAVASHVVSTHFDSVLERFNAQYPRVSYTISTMDSADVIAHLQQNQVTFGICLMQQDPVGLEARVMYREFFGFYCGPSHRLYGQDNIDVAELRDEDAVSFQTDELEGSLSGVARLRRRLGMRSEPRGLSSNLPEVRRMIVANIGIGALPVHIARKDVQTGLLWQVPPYGALPAVDIHMLTNPKRSMNRAEMALLEMLQTELDSVPLEQRTYHA